MYYEYRPSKVCSHLITLNVEGDVLKSVEFLGGCNGNLKGISALVAGMKLDDIIEKVGGITCGFKKTSCPDQLCEAIKAYKAEYDK